MTKYTKQTQVFGKWVKASELVSGKRATIISETIPEESQFQNKDGSFKKQDVAKIKFEGLPESLKVALNRATINGLVDAFGEDSKDWINKVLIIETEKMRVAGKAVVALYLIPKNYKKIDDENGYALIVKNLGYEDDEQREKSESGGHVEDKVGEEELPY